ncbi:MAG: hypothetical protein OEQ28_16425, partial [Acidobacteriota bacterium]|nr:hypothetical protein [Acidobacteriota bacterium]
RPDPAMPPSPPTPDKSRYDLSSSKSVVYRVLPDGTEDVIWNSEAIPAFAIAADPAGGGVFVGTSDKGRIFRISDSARESLLIQTEEEQISTLLTSGNEMIATTSNKGRSFRFGKSTADEGVYESPVLDAKSTALWGRLWSEKAGEVVYETRSGNSARPGENWSEWSPVRASDGKISSPATRYFQWRARLKAAGRGLIRETSVSFAALNIAPEVLSIEVLGPNVGLAPNPDVPIDPNIETLGLNPADFGLAIAVVPPRRVFQTGARGIQWQASDRNGDNLRYTVYLGKIGEQGFRRIGAPSNADFITLDGLTLEDGRYVVKIVADDSPSNGVASAKSGERISEPFEIDNSPPVVTMTNDGVRNGSEFTVGFSATEKSSFIRRAEFSVNGGKWYPVYPDDGIADGKTETFTVTADVGEEESFVLSLRVFDAVGQIGSMRVVR